MKFIGKTNEYLEIVNISSANCDILTQSQSNEFSLLWFQSDNNQLKIDAVDYTFNTSDILSLTEFHKIETIQIHELKLLRWNRSFYCILNNDVEIGCKGILYYGASALPFIHPEKGDIEILSAVWKMLEMEMVSRDNLQREMLQMMLKRILILSTRMYKSQSHFTNINEHNIDIIREYNFLVEQHFREKHTVAEYAELLYKSPKTLSNLFKKLGEKSPLQFIHNRKILEAKRLLKYTDTSVSEIGYELGFSDVQSFSRFFKKNEGLSPIEFKK